MRCHHTVNRTEQPYLNRDSNWISSQFLQFFSWHGIKKLSFHNKGLEGFFVGDVFKIRNVTYESERLRIHQKNV